MSNHPLFYSLLEPDPSVDLRDRVQIALAIADASMLTSLLVNSLPPIALSHQVGAVSTQLGVPTSEHQSADGVLHFERIQCVLSQSPRPDPPLTRGWTPESREWARLTQHESETHTLGQQLSLSLTMSLLAEAGFGPQQIDAILRLPRDGWHKSWWSAIDAQGNFTHPFLRYIRTLNYPDGTFTIQYKDFFEQDKPPCFTRSQQQVLVMLRTEGQGFADTLRQLNHQRSTLGITEAILICPTLSELEAQAFIRQGISVYPAIELLLPTQANCTCCGRKECPMNGLAQSPIALCHGFLPEAEYL